MNDVRTEVQHRQVENASPFDNETLVDQVWRDMSKTGYA